MSSDISNRTPTEAWLPVVSIAAGTFATVTTEFLPVGLLPQISGTLGISLSRAAWMITIPGLVAAAAAPLLLVGVGRMDRRHLLLFLTGLTAFSNLFAGLSHSFAVLLVARFVLGICVGGFWAFAANMGRRLVSAPSHNRATAIILAGIRHSLWSTGRHLGRNSNNLANGLRDKLFVGDSRIRGASAQLTQLAC